MEVYFPHLDAVYTALTAVYERISCYSFVLFDLLASSIC